MYCHLVSCHYFLRQLAQGFSTWVFLTLIADPLPRLPVQFGLGTPVDHSGVCDPTTSANNTCTLRFFRYDFRDVLRYSPITVDVEVEPVSKVGYRGIGNYSWSKLVSDVALTLFQHQQFVCS
jgi:hypothetical protein